MLASHYNSGAAADADGHSRHHLVSKQHHVIMARHPQVSSGWTCNHDPSEAGDRSEADGIQCKDGAGQQIDPSSGSLDYTTTITFVSRSNSSSTATVQEGEEEVDEVEELLQNSVSFNSKFVGGDNNHQHNNNVGDGALGNVSSTSNKLEGQVHLDDQGTAGDNDSTFEKKFDLPSCTHSDQASNKKLVDGSSVVADILSQVLEETDQFGLAYLQQSECRSNCSSSNSSSGISCSNRSNITGGTRSSSSSSSASEINMENSLVNHKSNNGNNQTSNMVNDCHNGNFNINGILTSTINSGITHSPSFCSNNSTDGLLSNFSLTSSLLKQLHNSSDSGGGSSRKSSEGDEPVSLSNTGYGYANTGLDATGEMIDADQLSIATHSAGYDGYAGQFSSLQAGGDPGFGGYNHDGNSQFTTNAGLSSADASLNRLSSLANPSLFKATTGFGGNGTPEDEMKLLLPELLRRRENSGSSRDSGYSSYFGTGSKRVHPNPSNNFNSSILDPALLSHLSRLTGSVDPGLLFNSSDVASALSSTLSRQLDDSLTCDSEPFFKGSSPTQDTFDLNNLSCANFSALSSNDVTLSDVSLTQMMPDASSFSSERGIYNLPSNCYDSRTFNSSSLSPDEDSIFSSLTQNMSEVNGFLPNQHFMDKLLAFDSFTMDDSKPSSWLNLEALLFNNNNGSSSGNHPFGSTDSGRMSVASMPSMDPLLASAHKLERMATAPNGFRMNSGNDFPLRPPSVHGNPKEPTLGPFGASKFQATNDFLSYQNHDLDDISQLLPSDPSAQEKFLDNIQLLNQLSNLSSFDADRRLLPPVPSITANNHNLNNNNSGFFNNFSRSHSSVNFPTGQHHQTPPVQQFGPLHHRPQSSLPHQQHTGQYPQTGQYLQQQGGTSHANGHGQQGGLPDGFILSQLLEKSISPANNASSENSSFSSGPNNEKLAELASVLLNTCKVSTIDISLSEVQLMLRRASLNDPFARNWLSRNFEFQRILSKAGINKRFFMPAAAAIDNSGAGTRPTYPSMYNSGNRQAFGDKYTNSGSSSQGRMPPPKSEYNNWSNYPESNSRGGPDSLETMRQKSLNTPRPEHRGNNGVYHHLLNNGIDNLGTVAGGNNNNNSYGNDSNIWNLDNYKITSLGNGGYITSKNCANFEKLTMHSSSKELPQHFSAPPPTPAASAVPHGKGAFPFPPSTPRPSSLKDYSSFDQLNCSQLEFALNNMDIASTGKHGRDGFIPPLTSHHRLLHHLPVSELMALNIGGGGKTSADDSFVTTRQPIPPELLAAAAAAASNQGLGGSSSSSQPPHLPGGGAGGQSDLSGAARGLAAALGGGRHPLPPMGSESCYHPEMMPFQHNLLAYRQLGPLPPLVYSLLQRIEDCYDQFRQVERQRKKTEAELARCFPGRRVSSSNTISLPRLPHNPTRLDRLVLDHMREHARVITLVAKMERLRNAALQPGIHKSLSKWHSTLTTLTTLRHADITHIILPPHLLHPHPHQNSFHHHPGHPTPSIHNPLHSPPPLPPTPSPGGYQPYSNVEKVFGNPPSLSNSSQPTPSMQGSPHPAMMSLQHLMSSPPPPISPHALHAAMQQQHAINNKNTQLESSDDAGFGVCNNDGAMPVRLEGAASNGPYHETQLQASAADIKQVKEEGPPEVVALSQCLCRVVQATRGARTALYCALTLTTLQHLASADGDSSTATAADAASTATGERFGGQLLVEGITSISGKDCVASRPSQSLGNSVYNDSFGSGDEDSVKTTINDSNRVKTGNLLPSHCSTKKRLQGEDHLENRDDEDDEDEDDCAGFDDDDEEDDDLKLVEALKKLFHYRDLMKKIETVDDGTATATTAEDSEEGFPSSGRLKKEAIGYGSKPSVETPTALEEPIVAVVESTTEPSNTMETASVQESPKKLTVKVSTASVSEVPTSLPSHVGKSAANDTPLNHAATAPDGNKKVGIDGSTVGNKLNSSSVTTATASSTSNATVKSLVSSITATNEPSKSYNNAITTTYVTNTSTSATGNVGSKPLNSAGVTSSSFQQPTHAASNSGSNRNGGHNSLFGSAANNGRKYFNAFGGGPQTMAAHYAKLGMAAPNRRPPFHHHPPPPHHHTHHHQQPHHNNHYQQHRAGGAINAVVTSNLGKVSSINVAKMSSAAAASNRDLRSSLTY